jgi:hypothetical protein
LRVQENGVLRRIFLYKRKTNLETEKNIYNDMINGFYSLSIIRPITAIERSKARNVFSHLNTEIVDSNTTLDMHISLLIFSIYLVTYR